MMTSTTSDFQILRFSSEDLRPSDRVPFYREVIGRGMTRFDKEPVGERFFCNAHYYRLPDLSISRIASGAVRANRTREMADGSSELILAMNLEGVHTVSQLGRERSHLAGSSIVFSGADASRIEHTTTIEHTMVRVVLIGVPRTVLAPMLSNPDTALMSVLPNTMEALRLLAGYIDLLVQDSTMENVELRRLAIHHVHDLVAMALGATRDAAEIAAGRGLRAARMRDIKADIEQNLQRDVSAAALSARHRLSPRYIRKLFEGENTSLSQFVLGRRLARVHRMLAEPRYADRTIADIALAVGFGDISTFNREFRRRFGVTPSDVRRARDGIILSPQTPN